MELKNRLGAFVKSDLNENPDSSLIGIESTIEEEIEYTPASEISIFNNINLDDDIETTKIKKGDMSPEELLDYSLSKIKDSWSQEEIDVFDSILDDPDFYSDDEGNVMANNLISMGRKYARATSIDAETAEIEKTYADSEKRLAEIYQDIVKERKDISTDIERARLPHRGSTKTLTELLAVKNSFYSTQLAIVKEINSMRKNKMEYKFKESAKKDVAGETATEVSTNLLQGIITSAKKNMVQGLGGYAGVSGAISEEPDGMDSYSEMDDDEIQRKYFSNDNNKELSDGDMYLKYENHGVELVLLREDGKAFEIIAETKDGTRVYDYPIPKNFDTLVFKMDESSMTASDNLHRIYKLRDI